MGQDTLTSSPEKPVSLGRHQPGYKICSRAERKEIEPDFIAWKNPTAIVKQHGLADRTSIYPHAHAFGLLAKRSRDVLVALEKIIERVSEVEVTPLLCSRPSQLFLNPRTTACHTR
jgi:hypothetical protein